MNQPSHRLRASLSLAGLAGALALAPAAFAQDSTCKTSGLPGDALDPKDTGEQVADFIVDLSAIQSTWGNTFGIAPLLKSSVDYSTPNFYNALISAQAVSVDQREDQSFPAGTYDLWVGPGFGVNTDSARNDPGTATAPTSALSSQFYVVFDEFSQDVPGAGTIDFGNIVTGAVNYDPEYPSRLYVRRTFAATNGPDWTDACASFGIGGVDSDGHVMVRGDGNGNLPGIACTPLGNFSGNDENYFRLDAAARNGAILNVIDDTGGSDAGATVRLLTNAATTHVTPTLVPSSVTGGNPILLGANFGTLFVYGSAPALSSTAAYLGGACDSRGTPAYTKNTFLSLFPSGVSGTSAILSKTDPGGGCGPTDRISIFGLSSVGAPLSAISRQILPVVIDGDDGWRSDFLGAGQLEFTHYASQVAFNGGNSMVALGKDASGNLIAAATVNHPAYNSNDQEDNLIAVARVDATSGATSWTVAAYCYDTGTCPTAGTQGGKAIYDGSGAVVGNLMPYTMFGSGICGPSISSPMIDSRGNILFIAPVDVGGDTGVGLLRAVYDEVSFSYRLECIFQSGDIVHGQNSDRDYLIRFLELNDSNSIDSGAPFSGNIIQTAWNNMSPAVVPNESSKSVGGVVINAGIIYDVDDDGSFDDIDTVPGSADQDYAVTLFITAADDCNDNGVPDDLDILNATSSDANGDGIPDECSPGTGRCFCDVANAPCGNAYPTGGCLNSTGVGAIITATGSNSIAAQGANPLVLHVVQGRPSKNYQFLQGAGASIQSAFRDGNLCVGNPTIRLPGFGCGPVPIGTFDSAGAVSTDDVVQGFDILSADTCKGGTIASQVSGSGSATRDYQTWFRDGMGPCGTGSNLTNATQVTWVP